MRTLIRGAGATAANALSLLAPQLVALFGLQAEDFGRFSLVYLVYALGCSVLLSVVCESSARRERRLSEAPPTTREYLGATGWVSIMIGALGGAVGGAVLAGWLAAGFSGVAVAAAVFRVGARFREVQGGAWVRATVADSTSVVVLILAYVGLTIGDTEPILALVAAWGVAGACASLVGSRSSLSGPRALLHWVQRHRRDIPPLLRESLVMDVSSIGAPFAIAPLLGVAQFGIYRAVSNVAAPVRLVLNPIRPRIAVMSISSALSRRVVFVVTAAAATVGVCAVMALWFIEAQELPFGVLISLAPYAVPCGLFVLLNFVGHYFYLVARTHASSAALWRGRLIQSGTALVLPVGGAVLGDLSGAVWMYVTGTAVGAVTWALVGRKLRD